MVGEMRKKKTPEEQHRSDFLVLVLASIGMVLGLTPITITAIWLDWEPLMWYGIPTLAILIFLIAIYLGYLYLPNSVIGRFIRYKQKIKKETQAENIN